ncbi:MAG: pre-peptidase C-terminal domain-containing protein [Planctomycetes bacterium]|nr:pre-peptidase C-terminal domain-containing protein [Planctomycetota bacterium]
MSTALFLISILELAAAEDAPAPDYSRHIEPIFRKYCTGCHNADDLEGGLNLESYELLRKGSEKGPVLDPGRSGESKIIRVLEGKTKPKMPPGKRPGPNPEELALLKAWIDAGAKGPASAGPAEPTVPHVPLTAAPRQPIQAVAYHPKGQVLAAGGYQTVELFAPFGLGVAGRLSGLSGNVNALLFSADGALLVAAGGEPGRFGEACLFRAASGEKLRALRGHRDALYAAALSPDGRILATGSWDHEIKLWEAPTGKELRALHGHNGAIFDLAFRPDGKILASASGDRTVKLWEVASGKRLDTFGQALKDLYTVAFSPGGRRVAAGGVDNRIRVWEVSGQASEGTNPLLLSRFAHEGPIVKLVYSADGRLLLSAAEDRTVKIWEAETLVEKHLLEKQSDWPAALAFSPDGRLAVVGRLDGTLGFYDVATGQPLRLARGDGSAGESPSGWLGALAAAALAAPENPPKPAEIAALEPRGVQRGVTSQVKLAGKNLAAASALKIHHPKVKGRILDEGRTAEALILEIAPEADLDRGPVELSVAFPGGESNRVKIHVDDLPQIAEVEDGAAAGGAARARLPASFWGAISTPGDLDRFAFSAEAGETVVLDLAAASLGSKLNGVLAVFDAEGMVLASSNDFDGQVDPLIAFTAPGSGEYSVQVSDLLLGASKEHHYRLSAGSFPMVTGVFPLSVPAGAESEVELAGFNIPPGARVKVKASAPGELEVPFDPGCFRSRGAVKALAGSLGESVESEPNDRPERANAVSAPAAVNGRIAAAGAGGGADADLFRFRSRPDQAWIIETEAARRGSPVDTKIEVLDSAGRPIERLLLQAVRDSYITFRGIDSSSDEARLKNWEEMELNEYLYMQGEVCKLFRAPQGPDSAFKFYAAGGRRRAYFDTSSTAHALDEPCYIVEPLPPGAKPVPNGLPVFPLYHSNDDDGERKLGRDSKVAFTPAAEGDYLVRVTDVRDQGGDRFAYRLIIREAQPDFNATLSGANPAVGAGSGKAFSVAVDRLDGFEGEVAVSITGLPPGFSVSTPLVIQAGHSEAKGTIHASPDAPRPADANAASIKVNAEAMIGGRKVLKELKDLGRIQLAEKPKLLVRLEPLSGKIDDGITLHPGQTLPAMLTIERNGHDDLVTFTVENLPHGVIVDDIGLNGVLIPAGQSERQIFLTTAKWVPETDRWAYAQENQAGGQTSPPVLVRVRSRQEASGEAGGQSGR